MHGEEVALGEVGYGEARHQAPMKETNKRVPDIDLWRWLEAIPIKHEFCYPLARGSWLIEIKARAATSAKPRAMVASSRIAD
jgi:hypothetical protein